MSGIKRPKYWAPDGDKYARAAVATIGVKNDTSGYLYHALQVCNQIIQFTGSYTMISFI